MPRMSWPRARLSPNACCCHRRGAQRCGPQPQHSVMFLHIRQPAGEWHMYCVTFRGHTSRRAGIGAVVRDPAPRSRRPPHPVAALGAAADSAPLIAQHTLADRRAQGHEPSQPAGHRDALTLMSRLCVTSAPRPASTAPPRAAGGAPAVHPPLPWRARCSQRVGRVQRSRRDSCGAGADRRGSCRVVAGACLRASPVRTRAAP